LLLSDKQLDAAEEAASRAIDLFPEKGEEYLVCQSHRVLGDIYRSSGKSEKAIHHFETALGIASNFNWPDELFWNHYLLAVLFRDEGRFGDAHAHIELAKSHVDDGSYNLGRAMEMKARIWYRQSELEEAKSEALRAKEIYEKLGAAKDLGDCIELLQEIEKAMESRSVSGEQNPSCEFS
jgi:tetratricopeptide (TPR) repeat protein